MTSRDDADVPAFLRADKWLWQARFFKSRRIAAEVVSAGHLRINGARAGKPAQPVRPGDTLTFPQSDTVRVVRIAALGTRRGPASEAQTLYEDLTPEAQRDPAAPRAAAGRPDRDARRAARAAKHGRVD